MFPNPHFSNKNRAKFLPAGTLKNGRLRRCSAAKNRQKNPKETDPKNRDENGGNAAARERSRRHKSPKKILNARSIQTTLRDVARPRIRPCASALFPTPRRMHKIAEKTKMTFAKKLTSCLAAVLLAAPAASASESAEPLFEIPLGGFSLPITNSIVTAWIVAIVLIVLVRAACGKPKLVPSKGQYVIESILGMFKEILEPILGKKAFPATFPLLMCLFFFILAQNWASLIPGIGTIGWHETAVAADGTETETFHALFRPLGADMNGTLGLALVSFGAWIILILKFAGPKSVLHEWFGNKADRREVPAVVYYFLTLIFAATGIIEIISILFRPVSLSFRLFGNVFGGETLLHGTNYLFVFYFLELLVGIVQALVFTLLSAVYVGLITSAHDDGGEHAEGAVPAPAE